MLGVEKENFCSLYSFFHLIASSSSSSSSSFDPPFLINIIIKCLLLRALSLCPTIIITIVFVRILAILQTSSSCCFYQLDYVIIPNACVRVCVIIRISFPSLLLPPLIWLEFHHSSDVSVISLCRCSVISNSDAVVWFVARCSFTPSSSNSRSRKTPSHLLCV